MKRWIALALALVFCLGAAGCGGSAPNAPDAPVSEEPVHKLGVLVYNTADEEVIGFREYLKGYIEQNFDMVEFLYSDSLQTAEQELAFIRSACAQGAEGFLSFVSRDLKAEVALCAENHAYYLLASGTVSDDDFRAVADVPWFLGMFGPGKDSEFRAGVDMAYFFAEKQAKNYFILSGGAPLGNEMHYQRTLGILAALANAYGVTFPQLITDLAGSAEPVTVALPELSVTICPGYIAREPGLSTAQAAYAGGYDAVLSVLPPEGMLQSIGKTPLGVVDAYHTRNLQLFVSGPLQYCVGKYSSSVGPAFALMLNAVTGYAADFRENGKAVKVTQGFWTSDDLEDYTEKYALSVSAAMNAYSFDDLTQVIRLYNPEATLDALVTLAEACSYEDVLERRG